MTTDAAASVFRAVSTPSRLELLARLRDAELNVGSLVEGTGTSASNVSHQLAEMRYNGLIERERRGQNQFYRLTGLGARLLDFAEGLG